MGVRVRRSVRQAFWERLSPDLHWNVYSYVWLHFFPAIKNSASTVMVLKANIQYWLKWDNYEGK